MSTEPPPRPERTVHHGDGLAFLARGQLPADHAIVTSLPDLCEVPAMGHAGWRAWFEASAAACCAAVADDAIVIFFQTDVKHDGRWVDKGHLVHRGADAAGSHLLWHKVVCRAPAGKITFGRPAYAHLLAFSRTRRLDPGRSTADVLPALGEMTWSRAMGTAACAAAARFLVGEGVRVVVDPFCGVGTMLAVANNHGLGAIGVELAVKRAARARTLVVAPG